MVKEVVMGIDVGTHAVKTVVAEKRNGDSLPYILATGTAPSHGLRKGFIINHEDVSISIKNSVKQALEKINLNLKKAFVSIDGGGLEGIRSKGSIVVARADNEITESDLKRALGQSETQLNRNSSSYLLNREILHTFPISYKIDDEHLIGDPVGMKGEKLEIETLFATGHSQQTNYLVKSMEMAGIKVENVVAAPWATSHAVLTQKEKEVGCVLVNIGGDTSSIVVFEEGGPVSMEIVPIGSNHITYDITHAFQVLLEEAESLKISYSNDSSVKRKLSGIVEPRLNDIFEFVGKHLNKIQRSGLMPGGIILTGGGANLSGTDEVAKKALKLPSQLSQNKLPENFDNEMANPLWSTAFGLCCLGLGEQNPIRKAGSKAKRTLLRLVKTFIP